MGLPFEVLEVGWWVEVEEESVVGQLAFLLRLWRRWACLLLFGGGPVVLWVEGYEKVEVGLPFEVVEEVGWWVEVGLPSF